MNAGGIDFGTSNSSVGYLKSGEPTLLAFGEDGYSVPTAIFYSAESAEVYFGKQAVSQYTEEVEGRLLRSLKSILGSSLMGEKTAIRNRRVAFSDIIQDFFGFLRVTLASQGQADMNQVVLGRPVHFVDDNPEMDRLAERQLREIAEKSGFEHVEFQFEPVAAALTYESKLQDEQLALVVDIGGGTADFSIIRLSPERHRQADRTSDILSTVGIHIGGTDFDRLLSLHSLMPLLGMGTLVKGTTRQLPNSTYYDLATWHRIPLLYNNATEQKIRQIQLDAAEADKVRLLGEVVSRKLGHALARKVEQSKIKLSASGISECLLQGLSRDLQTVISRDEFETAIGSVVERLSHCVSTALLDSQIRPEAITRVFYTGGTSAVPLLRQQFGEMFPSAQHVQGDTFGSVGLGLTIDAARRFA
ncbi:Hsp70 family protein [Granulosicoccus antarcticus]|uniref:Chaperone protein dnaK2 n=1 Tax=Granulosicoccus antarcticus IMCC3135 TaxID=1192854 RepID=A0A2Z2NV12_9GAMM|nr:Hsp70 family protein [Granulosicoccus antarcticus]ASJ72630.1 Chaperone protein dnaK2 [Granulosicoccus antarcticus IMCC3135]